MNFKFKLLKQAMKLLKPLGMLYNLVKGIIPKRKTSEIDELRAEIISLKNDLKKHDRCIRKLAKNTIKEKEVVQHRKQYVQAEMYTSVVNSGGKGGSESGGYILINLPADEMAELKDDFFNMSTQKIKDKLGIPSNKILKNVSKGETLSSINERFIEINGERKPFSKEALK